MVLNRYVLLLVHLVVALAAAGQSKLNLRLKKELDSIKVADQRYRQLLMAQGPNATRRPDPRLVQRMIQTDSANVRRIVQIIR